MKKKFAFFVIIAVLILCGSVSVSAAGIIDTDAPTSLTLEYQVDGTPISGALFEVYQIADVDEYNRFTTTEEYSKYNLEWEDLTEEKWSDLALTVKGKIWKDKLKPQKTGHTDNKGNLVFSDLNCGVYLVLGYSKTIEDKTYYVSPFFVCLPTEDRTENEWMYDVVSEPKGDGEETDDDRYVTRKVRKIWDDKGYENIRPKEITVKLLCDGKEKDSVVLDKDNNWRYVWDELDATHDWMVSEDPVEGYTENEEVKEDTFEITNHYDDSVVPKKDSEINKKLPQTGMVWWPVPVLICVGIVFLIIGVWRRKESD